MGGDSLLPPLRRAVVIATTREHASFHYSPLASPETSFMRHWLTFPDLLPPIPLSEAPKLFKRQREERDRLAEPRRA